jgi:hypothetical protein
VDVGAVTARFFDAAITLSFAAVMDEEAVTAHSMRSALR